MKSSTLRRSNLSKEKMAVLEALSNYKQEVKEAEITPEVYVRHEDNKEHEIDVLWQNFKSGQKSDKSPGVYLGIGFIAGIVTALIIMGLVGFFSTKKLSNDTTTLPDNVAVTQNVKTENVQNSAKTEKVVNADNSNSESTEKSEKKKGFLLIPRREDKKTESTNETTAPEIKVYQVKNGDTMSSILLHFYGRATKEREIKVLNANGMSNPNKLTAGEKIKIPMEK